MALLIPAFSAFVLFPVGVYAVEISDVSMAMSPVTTERAAITEGGAVLKTMQNFTFSNNVPVAPAVVKSSMKTLAAYGPLKATLQSTTNSKAVKMRVVNSSGSVLADWKTVANGTTVTLYTSTKMVDVYVQLQSTQSYVMLAQGFWAY